jgi:hypothetical protein
MYLKNLTEEKKYESLKELENSSDVANGQTKRENIIYRNMDRMIEFFVNHPCETLLSFQSKATLD